ncbi:MAG: IgGFc-binding protein, partial [Myxococcales bacterium]|nr:IgGFc-binding protein [Myxococcales bacterium]
MARRIAGWLTSSSLLLLACGDSATTSTADSGVTTATSSVTTASTSGSSTATSGETTAGSDTQASTSSESDTGSTTILYDVAPDDDAGPVGSACQQAEAENSNQGCEFWAVDLPNAWQVVLQPGAEDQLYAIVATNTSESPANVSVYPGNEDTPLDSATIPGGGLQVFTFDNALGTKPQENSYGTAYRVVSDRPITVYQFNPLDNSTKVYSNDASLLFPSHVLGSDYTAITGDAVQIVGKNAGAFVTVVGLEDDTVIEFFPPVGIPLYPGVLKLTVDRGQTYTLMSNAVLSPLQNDPGQGNLSGTRVEASKPVAVFSGNVCSFEPSPWIDCCCDHLEHQLLPLEAWGHGYVVVAAPPNLGDEEDKVRVRVTGSFDGTQLSYAPAAPPGAPTMINAYQTVVFEADAPFIVSSDRPFAVYQFILSNEYITVDPTPNDDADNGWWPGDP